MTATSHLRVSWREDTDATVPVGHGVTIPPPMEEEEPRSKHFSSTRNACKLCTPLGACLVFRGVEGCIPFLHGSQGCSTYIRRYLISHFREPMDIASSNFHEESAIFGGSANFQTGVMNVLRQYQPQPLAKTCRVCCTISAQNTATTSPRRLSRCPRQAIAARIWTDSTPL
jgi:nitrogenase molybdenum-iron protein alpha/beta subunit